MLTADAEASQVKQLSLRSHVRRQVLERVQRLALASAGCDPAAESALARLESDVSRTEARRAVRQTAYTKAVRKAAAARDRLRRSLKSATVASSTASQRVLRSRVQLAERQAEHAQRLCRQLLAHTGASQRLVCAAVELLRKEHLLLLAHGLTSPELKARFAQVVAHFEGRRKVAWVDAAAEDGADCSSMLSWTSDSTDTSCQVGGPASFRSRPTVFSRVTDKNGNNLRVCNTPYSLFLL